MKGIVLDIHQKVSALKDSCGGQKCVPRRSALLPELFMYKKKIMKNSISGKRKEIGLEWGGGGGGGLVGGGGIIQLFMMLLSQIQKTYR